jgi:hypothetical protein
MWRNSRKRLTAVAATLVTFGVVIGGASVLAPSASAAVAPSPNVVVTSLTVSGPADATQATLQIKTKTGSLTVQTLTVGVRTASGGNVDFPGAASNFTITTTPKTHVTGTRAFSPGTYSYFASYKYQNQWHEFPRQSFTIAPDTTPTPTPTPTDPAPTGTGPTWDANGAWTKKFSDEFNTTSLDTSKWVPNWGGTSISGPVNDAEDTCYSANYVTVSGGSLHLKFDGVDNTCKGATRPYTGSHINSDGKYSFSRGAVEYRAFFPKAADGTVANWPALWDDGQNWPQDGENDTAEGLDGQMCTNYHASGVDAGDCHGTNWAGAWHTFGYEWTATKMVWYYDGVKVWEQASTLTSPRFLILQNTHGEWGGPTLAPSDLQVDYVRVWQH